MNTLNSFQRKMVYLVGIVVLMVPIFLFGSTTEKTNFRYGLQRLRADEKLGESSLGKVDPASSTFNVVLLGFRGIAASILWQQADYEKNTKNFAQLGKTVESISLLQPHFNKVWQYQAWNLAFNVSAECDAVKDRFHWVKQGAKFLQRGIDSNERSPELHFDMGEFVGRKIGRSDEKVQFRKFFMVDPREELYKGKADPDINPTNEDNYIVAKRWFEKSNDLINAGEEQHRMDKILMLAYPYHSQRDYATARKDEGLLDAETTKAWQQFYSEWTGIYGQIPFESPGGWIFFEAVTDDRLRNLMDMDKQKLTGTLPTLDEKRGWVSRYQSTANYRFWRARGQFEMQPSVQEATKALTQGRKLYFQQELTAARENVEKGLAQMKTAIDTQVNLTGSTALLTDDDDLAELILKAILVYQRVLDLQEKKPLPDSFPLKEEFWDSNNWSSKRRELEDLFRRVSS
jgi:hypothetical protein